MASRVVSVILQANIGQYVSQLQRAAGITGQLGRQGQQTGSQTGRGFSIAGKGAELLGFAAAGALTTIVKSSMDFEKAMSGVQASTQASAGTMQDLRAAALKAGADTSYSATEAAAGITEMAKAGVSAKDIMGGGLKGALSLAAAGQLDVADASSIASIAMTQFKLAGGDLPHVADLLAAGAGKANGSVSDLGQALNQAGLIAANAGLSIEDTTGVLAAFASAGLVGSDAGTSLKTMLQKLQNPSLQSQEALDQLGITMYDTSGKFVGITNLAGQLHDKLGGLSQAQRDAALAQIFGSDAVRAATVLYQQGSGGIQGWINKVNDSGYASKQAAQLQDNLAGDLEKLGGSFDTLFIKVGGGTQGPLRALVESFTGVINVIGDAVGVVGGLPGPVLAGVAALTALWLINGPLSGALLTGALTLSRWVGQAGQAAAANGILGASFGLVRGAAAGVMGIFGGPWGIAITAVTVGLGFLISALTGSNDATKKSSDVTEKATQAQQSFADAIKQANGAIDDNVRHAAAKAAQDAGLLDAAENAGVATENVTDALLGNSEAYGKVKTSLEQYIQSERLAQAAGGDGADAHARNAASAEQQLGVLDKLAQTYPDTVAAQDQLTRATEDGTSATDTNANRLKDMGDAASSSKKEIDALKTALDLLTGASVSTDQATSDFYAAVDSATGALKDMHGRTLDSSGSLDLQSESGRKAFDVLTGVASAGNTLISTLEGQGATTEQVIAKDAELRASFIKSAQQMGISAGDAENLANKIYGIPAQRTTEITADTTSATTKISAFVSGLKSTGFVAMALHLPTNAEGGHIRGPGTGTSDSIISRVSNGEFIVKASQTAKHLPLLHAINDGMPGFADGGLADFSAPIGMSPSGQAALDAYRAQQAAFTGTGTGAGGINKILGMAIAAAMGFGSQFNAIDYIFSRESGWNNLAQNPTSTAFGIPQFLNSTWAAYGGKTTNPSTQIHDGISYMRDRYGSPNNAAKFWASHHWYDNGGFLPPGPSLAFNGTGSSEHAGILTDNQWQAMQQVADMGFHLAEDGSWVAPDFYNKTANSIAAGARQGFKLAEDGSWVPDSFYSGITDAIRTGLPAPTPPPVPVAQLSAAQLDWLDNASTPHPDGYVQAEDGSWVSPKFYARAAGGPVWPGQTFLVGENGPEFAQFGSHGTITPMRSREFSGSSGSGGGSAAALQSALKELLVGAGGQETAGVMVKDGGTLVVSNYDELSRSTRQGTRRALAARGL